MVRGREQWSGARLRFNELPLALRARCDATAHDVPGTLAEISRAVEKRSVERCRVGLRALCRRVGDASADHARGFLLSLVQFGGPDVLLSTLSLLPESGAPTAAVLALLNDGMYIRAMPRLLSPPPLALDLPLAEPAHARLSQRNRGF